MTAHQQKGGVVRTLIDNSALLIAGAVIALVWANVHTESYNKFVHYDVAALFTGDHPAESHDADAHDAGAHGDDTHAAESHDPESDQADADHADPPSAAEHDAEHGAGEPGAGEDGAVEDSGEHGGHGGLTIHFLINDLLMALFFAIAAKEVWESLLPGGALSNPRKAATPLLATLGGILGPALIYVAGTYLTGTNVELGRGWAIPCATDIAFSYLIARMIFGNGHPAIAFLLLLAIADDAAGLLILAVFYPQEAIEPQWLLLTIGAMLLALLLRRSKVQTHWAYLLGPGIMSWFSFQQAHIHPALGLVPIIPLLPHAHTDLGIFAKAELDRDDTLNEFEHFWKTPVEFILCAFGLANAGVVMSSLGTGTWLVLAGLLIGKPVGITIMTLFAEKGLKLEMPAGMDYRHIVTLGMVAGIGFTVALFVSVAAFTVAGPIQDSVKMGALLSFAAAPLAIVIGRVLGIKPLKVVLDDDQNTAQAA